MKFAKILTVNIALLALLSVFGNTGKVYAREVCFTQYGGGETCVDVEDNAKIDLDKQIYNPKTEDWSDHIRSTVYMFDAGDRVTFKIKIKNTGDTDLTNVEIKDILPDFVKYDSGDGDANDEKTEVKFDIDDLDKDEEATVIFVAKIASDDDLPKDDKLCVTNVAKVKGYSDGEKEEDADYANFCINLPEVLGTPSELPKAGAENALAYIGSVVAGLGLLVKRKLGKK